MVWPAAAATNNVRGRLVVQRAAAPRRGRNAAVDALVVAARCKAVRARAAVGTLGTRLDAYVGTHEQRFASTAVLRAAQLEGNFEARQQVRFDTTPAALNTAAGDASAPQTR